jgi:two-component system response regulator HydG
MKKEGRILVVDDDKRILESSKQLLKHDFDEVEILNNPEQIPYMLTSRSFDVILLDMNFKASISSGNEGLYWLREILRIDPLAIIIMITAYGDIDLAVEAMQEGSTNFIQKPWDPAKLIATIQSGVKFRKANIEVRDLKKRQRLINTESLSGSSKILGKSKAIKECLGMLRKVANTEANILLVGENGTGKELFAQEAHKLSVRKEEIFIPVDMGSISSTLFESELFGHKKGSFTDAHENRVGRIELAHGGTLFLDEIGNLPMSMQPKILTTLEQRTVTPVGSNNKINVNIRLISATNMDLQSMVTKNLFRQDLLYRLNTIEINIPPLREREEDIILLTDFFLGKFCQQYQKHGIRITGNTYDQLMNHSWPGNVRELKHAVERAVILSDSNILQASDFFNANSQRAIDNSGEIKPLATMEKSLITRALERNNMNISNAAKELQISRTTLYSKMKKYDL